MYKPYSFGNGRVIKKMLWDKIEQNSYNDKSKIKFLLVIFALFDVYKWLIVINVIALSCSI